MRSLMVVLISFWFTGSYKLTAQQLITWQTLEDVKFTNTFSTELGFEVLEAQFGPSVKSLDNQEVTLKGFMIPLDPLGTQYVLSRYPMANCFFCGGAGPESVVELRLHPKSFRRYAMDETHTFKGKLILNEKNTASLNYIITNAERL